MSYVGQAPLEQFAAAPTKDVFTGDASTTAFDLATAVAAGGEHALEVYIDNVRQEPGTGKAFTLGIDGSNNLKRITFTAAPASSAAIYVLNPLTNVQAIAPVVTDLNGVELILDADGDSSITADTDDRFDFKISGTDQIQLADGVLKPVTDSDVDLGTSSLYFKNAYIDAITTTGNVTVGGDLTITGTTSFADTNITNVGSIALDTITNDGTDITLDSGGDIILDADGTQVFLKDGGTTFGSLTQVGGQLVIKSSSSDTTALTFAGANATLAGTLGVGAVTSTGIVTGTAFTAGSAVLAEAELELLDGLTAGTAIASKVVTTDASIDTTGQRNLTISGELDAATGDFSGDVDVDGTLEADAITINGTAIGSVYGVVAGSSSILTTGALASGSIAAGFGAIDNGTSGIRTNTFTVETSVVPDAQDGAALGTSSLQFSDLFLADGAAISFGDDNEITLTHVADDGLVLKHVGTGDGKEPSLTFQAGDNDIAINDVLGSIFFQAPDEGAGSDAIEVAAGIEAVAEGNFAADSNATSLVFKTGASEAATAKVKITSAGHLVPNADDTYDLGTSGLQWRNIYTGDLNLSNMSKTKGNKVDGTKGNWTVQEGDKDLYLINNNTNKKYKFNLTEI